MFKHAYFLEKKTVKNRLSVEGSISEPYLPPAAGAPKPPRWYPRLLLQICQVYF